MSHMAETFSPLTKDSTLGMLGFHMKVRIETNSLDAAPLPTLSLSDTHTHRNVKIGGTRNEARYNVEELETKERNKGCSSEIKAALRNIWQYLFTPC